MGGPGGVGGTDSEPCAVPTVPGGTHGRLLRRIPKT